ncbi:MAG TPA: cytochrome ubiquinol oxidase subunit I [Thermomicrobiales bacterium]|nr:cytochrome ubiquinol oxidase subunit I [Thermomicrobiales bacterium]
MSDLLAARLQMAMSLGFHIIFASVGIAMPLLMVISEGLWLRTGDETYLKLARRWAKGTAILFAVGAVSGTVLSFELGLLWPRFMGWAGGLIGMPFSLEGFAFFTEAIFLGVYLYGWDRVGRIAHWVAGWLVAISGTLSGIFVVMANAWMNQPAGFDLVDGQPENIDPMAAMFNDAAFHQTLHMTIAAFLATSFAVAAIHTALLRRHPGSAFHRKAIGIALTVGVITAVIQPISGDISARFVAENQPAKLAALEAHWETAEGAALTIGGIPDADSRTTRFGIQIPRALSLLAHHDPNAEVTGLDQIPEGEWPPVAIVHIAFQIMVGIGFLLMGVGIWGALLYWRRRAVPEHPWFQWALMLCGPLGFVAVEAGWTVTEVGRQPWIIFQVMRTEEALTQVPNLIVPLISFTVLYILLSIATAWLLYRQVVIEPREEETGGEFLPRRRHATA